MGRQSLLCVHNMGSLLPLRVHFLGYILRILDLAEPIKNNQKYKTYLYKIQSKHVDFVICDPKLVARCIIELDDNSHNTPERKQRDEFVDNVLSSVGYQILHVRAINIESIEATIAEIFIHNK